MRRILLLLTVLISSTYCFAQTSQGLIAHYPLNGNANDSSGNNNNGTLSGVTFASGDIRTFAQFSATSYINVPDNSTFDFSSASGVTIATWVKREQDAAGYILIKMGTSGSSDDEYSLSLDAAGYIQGAFNSPTTYKVVTSKSSIALNNWTHIALRWNQSDSKIAIYINGILDTIATSTVTSIQNTSQPFRIGKPQHNANSLIGSIDDIKIYNRALSDQEIYQLFNPSTSQGLIAHYPLNGNANDSSGNNNNGTLSGVTFASGDIRTFAQFSATSYINVPDNSTFDFSSASGVTIATWVKREQDAAGYILIKMGTSGSSDDEYSLSLDAAGYIQGAFNSPTTYKVVTSKSSIALNNWTHIALRWNQSDSKIAIYINGILDTIATSTVTSIQNTSQPFRIGKPQHNANSLIGSIDDIKIYNRALSDLEIYLLYDSTVDVESEQDLYINQYVLDYNYPNPFNPTTKINYFISQFSKVQLKVFDVLGREVAILVDQEQSTGHYSIDFNAENLSAGIYFYQLQADNFSQTKKMILLK